MPVSAALNLGMQTLTEAIQLTPASPALAVLTTSRNILEMVNSDKRGQEDEQRLAQMAMDIAVAYSDGIKKLDDIGCKDAEIERISCSLHKCLESIASGLQNKPKAGAVARILSHSATQRRLKAWEADLAQMSLLIETQIRLRCAQMSQSLSLQLKKNATNGSMEERIRQANQEALDFIKSQVLKQTRKKLHNRYSALHARWKHVEIYDISSFGHFPPAASTIFYGRSNLVEWLVESLVEVPSYHAILGPGGIGKTSLGLNMLHDPRIVEVYGNHRYFLACETISDASGIIAGLADIFSLNEGAFVTLFKQLCKVIDSSILFLLDNFETPWEQKETRRKVEELLTHLSSIPNLSIVVTLRGAERPGGLRWSRPFLPVLGPLELSAARQTFMTIADTRSDDADMERLLNAVECIPLAITLLAAQASYTNCTLLLEQWETCKTSMVTRGWDGRLSNLDVSISLSLASKRFISNPRALSLLQILSLLPDGASVEELRMMTAADIDVDTSVSTLLQVALANVSRHDHVVTLAPIREYVQARHPISHVLLRNVFSYHAELSRYAKASQWTSEKVNMDAKLSSCIGNLHSVLWVSLGVETLTDDALNAIVNVASFRRLSSSGSISMLLEQSMKIVRKSRDSVLLARCLRETALRMWSNSSDRMPALACLEESANTLRCHSSSEGCEELINALCDICCFMLVLGRIKEGLILAQEAVGLISPSTSPVVSALAYMRFGDYLLATNDYSGCRKALELAGSYFHPNCSPELSLRLYYRLCRLYSQRDMYSRAIEAADMGLSFQTPQDAERALLLIASGNACLQVNRYEDAQRVMHQAIQCLALSGSLAHLTLTYRMLGLSYLACGSFTEATLSFHTAHQFTHADVHTINPSLALAMVELYQNRLEESLIHLKSASKESSTHLVVSFPHLYTLQVRCQVQIRQGEDVEALTSCVLAATIAYRMQERSTIAVTLLWLGDAFFIQRDVSTSKACYQSFLDLVRYIGNRRLIANALLRLGVTDYVQGNSSLAFRRIKQAELFYEETDGRAWVEFCKEILRLIDCAIDMDDIPFFPPVSLNGF